MSNTYVLPQSFASVPINGNTFYDCQAFELPIPTVISSFIRVAGGEYFDFNYGQPATLLPRPFSFVMVCYGDDEIQFASAWESFFGLPPTGLYGTVGTMVLREHGRIDTVSADCEFTGYSFVQDVSWWNSDKKMVSGVRAQFRPRVNFS